MKGFSPLKAITSCFTSILLLVMDWGPGTISGVTVSGESEEIKKFKPVSFDSMRG
jgi:hypothetical protein